MAICGGPGGGIGGSIWVEISGGGGGGGGGGLSSERLHTMYVQWAHEDEARRRMS